MEKYTPKVGDKFYVNGIFGYSFNCSNKLDENIIYATENSSKNTLAMDVRKLDFIKIE